VSDAESMGRLGTGAGSLDAYESIFKSYYAQLVGVAESMLRERAAAEDVVQDVMVELWHRRATIKVETSLRAYLFRAVRNRALNQLRHRKVAPLADPDAADRVAGPAGDRDFETRELNRAVRKAVAGLPDRCREVFELSRVQGLSYDEIARVMEISVKTVEAQMGKALRVLREELAAFLPGNL
jgi:RNA polymerase sigma-70 factor (ECF subfamily)